MIKKLLPVLLILVALIGGIAAGEFLKPAAPEAVAEAGETATETEGEVEKAESETGEAPEIAFFQFPKQFFVPIMRGNTMDSVMILSLTVEYEKPNEEEVFKMEHRLRDAFLRSLMIYANTGGFDGNFTADAHMGRLKESLVTTAKKTVGAPVVDVLIEDIARQEQS